MGLLLRLWGLASPGLWHDEALSHFYALHEPSWILEYCAGPINHPPLFFLLLHGWLSLVPVFNQAAVELFNVIVGVLTLGVFYRWVWFSLNERWAAGLTLVLALHPFHVYYSSELRMYALAGFGLVVVLYFSTRLLFRGHRDRLDWMGWCLGSLVAMYSHSFTVLPVMVVLLFLGYTAFRDSTMDRWVVSSLALVILYLPWSIFVLNQALRISGDYWLPPFQLSYLWTLVLWMGGYVGPKTAGFYNAGMTLLLCVGLLVPLCVALTRWRKRVVRLCWLVVVTPTIVVVSLSLSGQSVFLYRVFFPLLPVVIYLVGQGYISMPYRLALVCFFSLMVLVTVEVIQLKNNPPNQYVRDVADWIQQRYSREILVLHTSGETYFPSRFYHSSRPNEFFIGARDHLGVTLSKQQRADLGVFRDVLLLYPGNEKPPWVDQISSRIRRKQTLKTGGRTYRAVLLGDSR